MKLIVLYLLFVITFVDATKIPIESIKNSQFTAIEQNYIKQHPVIKVHNEADWAPYNYNQDGKPIGYSIEYMKLIASKIGLSVDFVSGYTWNQFLGLIKENKIDVMLNIAKNKERETYLSYTTPMTTMIDTVVTRRDYTAFGSLKDFEGKTIAIVKGFYEEAILKQFYPKIHLALYDTTLDALQAVSRGEADGTINSLGVVHYFISQYNLSNIEFAFEIRDSRFNLNLHIATNKSNAILRDILEKAKNMLTVKELIDLKSQWLYPDTNTKIKLTQKESSYLKDKKEIKVCVDPNWMPFEKIENGQYTGMGSDYMKLFSRQISTHIVLIQTKTWAQSLQKIKSRECDILPMATQTILRDKYLDFTSSYATAPIVIATKTGIPFIEDIQKILTKKIGIVRDYSLGRKLQKEYPDINIVTVDSIQDGLEMVKQGQIFAYLDNSIVLNYEIQKRYLGKIAISGKINESYSLSVATRSDEPILHAIFQKLVSSLKASEKEKIVNRWTSISYSKKIDYTSVWQTVGISILIVLFLLYKYVFIKRVMQQKIDIKTKELKEINLNLESMIEQRLEEIKLIKDRFQLAIDGANDGLWDRNLITEQMYYSPRFKEQLGYRDDEMGTDISEWIDRVHPDDMDQIITDINNYLEGKTELYENEHRIKHKDGSWIWVLCRAKALFDSDGKPTRLVGFHTDITRTKELEENLHQLVEKKTIENLKQGETLQHQSKLMAMGEMLENIAHQWRQPLAQINSAVLLLDEEMQDLEIKNPLMEDKLDEIESMTAYMSKTIDDFKSFYRDDNQKRVFLIEKSVMSSVSLVSAALKYHSIEISIDIDKDIKINSFKSEFEQVVLILMNNAKDVLITRKIKNPKIVITLKNIDNSYELSVRDNGGGIDEKIIDKIFEPYFTTKHKSQGTGLGLYLSRVIINKNMDSGLWVENIDGGACFVLELPKL